MLRRMLSTRLLALLVILATPVLGRAQVLADRVPDDAILYIGWRGVDDPGKGFQGSNLQAVLKDSNLPEVFDEFIPRLLDRAAQQDKQTAEGIRILRAVMGPMWRHPSAIAFAGIDTQGPNGPMPKFVLLSDAGQEAGALKGEIDALLRQAGQTPFPVHTVQQGNLVAIAVGYANANDALPGGAAGGNAKSLAKNADFVSALAQVDKHAVITGYLNIEKLLAQVEQLVPFAGQEAQAGWPKVRDALGLAGLKRVIWTEGFDGKDWSTRAFIAAPAPRKGMLPSLLDAPPLSDDIFKAIPEHATLAAAGHFDLNGFVTAIRKGITSLNPDAAPQIDQAVGQINQMLGMDLQKDLLASFGSEWAYYTDPTTAGKGLVGITIVNHPADPAKLEKALTNLEDFINRTAAQQLKQQQVTVKFQQVKIGGATIHYLGFPAIAPAWSIQDGNLYIALYPEVVAAAVENAGAHGASILDNKAFVSLRKKLGDHKASSIQFMDLPKLAPQSYPTWLVISRLSGVGDLLGVPAPVMILPPLKKLLTHLSAAGQIAWTEDDGVHVRGLSPFPGSEAFATDPGAIGGPQEAMLISVLLPALNRAREQANRVKSANNLRQIGLAAFMYANQQNGKLPKDFATLYKDEDLHMEMFINPHTKTSAPAGLTPEQQQAWVNEHSDYVWNGAGKKNTMGSDEPLAWEKPEGAAQGLNILYGDGHVEWHAMPDALEQIHKAEAKRGKGGGNAGL